MTEEKSADDHLLYDRDEGDIEGHGLTTEDAVSLFNSSLSRALERQKDVIIGSITQQLGKTGTTCTASKGEAIPFEFKHEGHKIQFHFNQERLKKLEEIENAVQSGATSKAKEVIAEERASLTQRNKILKIADRHGWDTVNEYLDDPLADNNDDAVKLRYAVARATRKRGYRQKPYERRRASAFSPADFFRGFGRSTNTPGSASAFKSRQDFMPGIMQQFPRDRNCFYCRQPGHIVRECPLARAQAVPTPPAATVTTSSQQ